MGGASKIWSRLYNGTMKELSLSGHTHTASDISGLSGLNVVYLNNGIIVNNSLTYIYISTNFKAKWFILCDVAYATNGKSAIIMGYSDSVVAFTSTNSNNGTVSVCMLATGHVSWDNQKISIYNNNTFGWGNAFAIYG